MADPAKNLESILAALGKNARCAGSALLDLTYSTAARNAPTTTPPQGQPGLPPPSYPPQPAYQQQPAYANPAAYASYPQPTSSGSLDLSGIQPSSSGNVSIQDAIARAKAHAAQNGVTPYDRPITYSSHSRPGEPGRYRNSRSRSRSPPARRDAFRDNYNPYRDERRSDRDNQYTRERSYSPPRGRDRNAGAFSPRGANGHGRQRSPPRGGGGGGGGGGGDDNSEIMQIEASLVGLIIGRQGENLRRVETDSNCRVQFLAAVTPDEQFRQCKITGPPARRAEAKAAINRIIEDSGMGAIARAGLDRPVRNEVQAALKDGEDCMQIMVPDRTVGLIIGRGGETIRDLQERSGCHINIVGESKSVNGLRPVNLIGPRHAAIKAKDLIMEIVDSDSRNGGAAGGAGAGHHQQQQQPPQGRHNPRDGGMGGGGGGMGGPDKINDSIYVPSEAVGMIIGKGGETIREMQNQTGCKINVSQSSGPGEVEREIGLVGSRDAISRAKRAIEDKVDAVRQKNSGGGGGGGGGGGRGGRGQQRDYENPNYGHQQSSSGAAPANPPAVGPPAGASGGADPYAACESSLLPALSRHSLYQRAKTDLMWTDGGYNAYVAMWYQALAQQAAQGGAPGDAPKPPGTS